jgi:hypothetical protein
LGFWPPYRKENKGMKGFGFFKSTASLVGSFQRTPTLPPASNQTWPNIRNEGSCEDPVIGGTLACTYESAR